MITTANLENILARPIPSVIERATYLLQEAERGLSHLGDRFNINEPRFLAATYSSNHDDVNFLLNLLSEQGLAKPVVMGGQCEILPHGYIQLDELKQKGTTIMLVSHDMSMINKLCNRLVLLDKGKIIWTGPASAVIPYYIETVGDKKGIAVLEQDEIRAIFNNG